MGRFKDLHIALPEATARSVDRLARARGLKRVDLLRQAVERYLEQAAREARDAEMRGYVGRMAPHNGEFVKVTASSVRRLLLEETEW